MFIWSVFFRKTFTVDGGIQRFQAQFAFLMAASCIAPLASVVLSQAHHLHGFANEDDYRDFLRVYRSTDQKVKLKHDYFPRPEDSWARRMYKLHRRHLALWTAIFFTSSIALWLATFITIAFAEEFWQTNCEDLVATHVSVVLLAFPVMILCSGLAITLGFWVWVGLRYAGWEKTMTRAPRKRSGLHL